MSMKIDRALIGAFVLGAIALIVVALAVFGSGALFTSRPKFVVFFEGSVKGLNVGAPVVFRGVEVGSVTDIQLRADPKALTTQIPVFIEIDPRRIRMPGGEPDPLISIPLLVNRGLRAQLQLQSVLTGQLMVSLDFYPDTKIRLVNTIPEYPEIPTVPSTLQELSKTIEKLPLEELATKLTSAIVGIERVVNALQVEESIVKLNQTLEDVGQLAHNLNAHVEPIADSIDETMREYKELATRADAEMKALASRGDAVMGDYGDLAKSTESHLGQLTAKMEKTLESTERFLSSANDTSDRIDHLTSETSPLYQELTKAMEELSSAARSIRVFADYLKQHPESLVHGKGGR